MERWFDSLIMFCRLVSRQIIRIQGPDSLKLLQALSTNQMNRLALGPVYSGFLEPNGRVLFDAFLYPEIGKNDSFLLDIDRDVELLAKAHIRKYLMRSKVTVHDAPEFEIWQSWAKANTSIHIPNIHKWISAIDPRCSALGVRHVIPTADSQISATFKDINHGQVSEVDYTINRIMNAVPEGPRCLIPHVALAQESNLDYLHASILKSHIVDYNKGCYLGQELTIRTHHVGVVRKRIVPVQFGELYASIDIEPAQNIPLTCHVATLHLRLSTAWRFVIRMAKRLASC